MFDRLSRELNGFLDLLFPAACPLCYQTLPSSEPSAFCSSCRISFTPLPSGICSRCTLPFPSSNSSAHLCESCSRSLPPYLSVAAVGVYEAGLRKAVHRFKYEGGHDLDRPLGVLLFDKIKSAPIPDLVVPVPLHKYRLRERSYNQSLLLARELGDHLSCPVSTDLLQRVRDTPQQQGLRARERARNLRDAFDCRRTLTGERVLLVDDVMTTGATAAVCSQILLDAGASDVRVAVVGRAGRG
ncbi:MAG TPA: ComF family protein [Geopsychrobacteraceae bacterium]|nr:ComF family protein [Geopsychrobacteraceae bacterium]